MGFVDETDLVGRQHRTESGFGNQSVDGIHPDGPALPPGLHFDEVRMAVIFHGPAAPAGTGDQGIFQTQEALGKSPGHFPFPDAFRPVKKQRGRLPRAREHMLQKGLLRLMSDDGIPHSPSSCP